MNRGMTNQAFTQPIVRQYLHPPLFLPRFDAPAPAESVYRRRTVLKPGDTLRLDLPGMGPIEIPVATFCPVRLICI